MSLDVDKVTSTLELKDQWNATLDKAAANTTAFEKTVTTAMTRAGASTDQLSRTTLTMSGRLSVAQAASRSIQGEISTLAATIVEAGGATAEQARQMNALSLQLRRVEGASAGFRTALGGVTATGAETVNVGKALHQSFSTFDNLLASVGINLGAPAKGLAEIAGAAGESATSMGLLATAGLAVGTGIAAWKIGRAAAEFFDLDKKIGDATAKLLGFGDAAAAAAGAKADVLAKASKIAGTEITSLGLAMAINADAAQRHAESIDYSAAAVKAFDAKLAEMRDSGTFDKLAKQMQSGIVPVEKLVQIFGKDAVDAYQYYEAQQQKTMAAEEKAADAQHARNERLLKDSQTQFAADQALRAWEAQKLAATTKLWDEYYKLRLEHGGTSNEIAIAEINDWAAKTKAAAEKAGLATKGFYDALAAESREKMAGVGIDWDLWRTKSRDALQEVADNALKTLNAMIASGKFNRDTIDEQRQKWEEAQAAVQGYGTEAAAASAKAKEKIDEEAKAREANLAKIKQEREEMEKRRMAGGAFDVTSQNFEQTITGMITTSGRNPTGAGSNLNLARAYDLARQGYSMAEIVAILTGPSGPIPPPHGPRIPGFATGGIGDFGTGTLAVLHGREAIVPIPAGTAGATGTAGGVVIHFAPGAIVLHQPFLNDPRNKADLARFMGEVFVDRLSALGIPVR